MGAENEKKKEVKYRRIISHVMALYACILFSFEHILMARGTQVCIQYTLDINKSATLNGTRFIRCTAAVASIASIASIATIAAIAAIASAAAAAACETAFFG